MKIAYNPIDAAALVLAPANNDITFDLSGLSIYVKGVRFKGTDTTYSVFKKHDESGGGYDGLVPVPNYNNNSTNRFLKEDGVWSSDYVTLTTTLYIRGQKTFQDLLKISDGSNNEDGTKYTRPIVYMDSSKNVIYSDTSLSTIMRGSLVLFQLSNGVNSLLVLSDSVRTPLKLVSTSTVLGTLLISTITDLAPLTVKSSVLVTNLNADMLDGVHESGFIRFNARIVDGLFRHIGYGYSENNWWTVGPAISFGADSEYYAQLQVQYDGGNPRIRNHVKDSFTDWKTIAFLTDNVASATKLQTARTISLTGSVTGSVSFDGSASVSIVTTTNHTHTFASITDKPTTVAGYGIKDAMKSYGLTGAVDLDTIKTNGTYYISYDATNSPKPYSEMLCMHNGDTSAQLAISHNSSGCMYYRGGKDSSGYYGWRTVLDTNNYNSYAPTLTGTGASGTWGISISGNASTATNADMLDGYHASSFALQRSVNDLIAFGNEFTFAPSGFSGGIYFNYRTAGGTNGNITEYIFGNGKGGSLGMALHTGNYNSYAPTLTGKGASGTWGINITGNAATATNADTLDGYHASSLCKQVSLAYYSDYSQFVFGLCQITDFETKGNFASGSISVGRNNGVYDRSLIHFSIQIRYNTSNVFFSYSYIGRNLIQPCTFTYNSKKWAGFVFRSDSASINEAFVQNYYSLYSTAFYVRYYNTQTGVVNDEVNSSLSVGGSDIVVNGGYFPGNAASATKLQTARTIWGQNFDGTANVNGRFELSKTLDTGITTGIVMDAEKVDGLRRAYIILDPSSPFGIGIDYISISAYSDGHCIFNLPSNGSITIGDTALKVYNNGNIGIGTASPAYKLHVAGDIYTTAGFKKNGSSDSYVLLGGGGHKALSDFALGNYLPISGGTMTGAINSTFSSGTWIGGVSNACLNGAYTGYGAILNMPVASGRVSLSTYPGGSSNLVYLGYASSTQISNGTNSFNKALTWDAVNNNLTADTFTGALAGNAATASKWKSPITLTISGSVTGSASVDGSGNVTISTSTNHSHSGYLTSHQTIYSLYLRSGSFSNVTYTPNRLNEWVYIPTTTDHLTEGTTNLFYTDARVQNIVSGKYLPLAGGTMNKDATIGSNTSLYVGSNNNWLYVSNIGSRNGTSYWNITQAGVATFKGTVTASEFLGNATTATALTTSAGSATKPVYFSNGKPVEVTSVYAGSVYIKQVSRIFPILVGNGDPDTVIGTPRLLASFTGTIGSPSNPIYIKDGIPTACNGTLTASSATLTASSATVGGKHLPVYLENGVITRCSYKYYGPVTFSTGSGGRVYAYKYGPIVILLGYISNVTTTSNGVIFTLPSSDLVPVDTVGYTLSLGSNKDYDRSSNLYISYGSTLCKLGSYTGAFSPEGASYYISWCYMANPTT